MYLGRPHCIKLDDVTVPRPSSFVNGNSLSDLLDMKLAGAWADLLEIVGHICDALYVSPKLAIGLGLTMQKRKSVDP
jgi:hypothetical protein